MAIIAEILENKGSEVLSINPDATVFEAIKAMVDANCGSLLVVDGDDIAGIFTERDYLRRVALEGRNSRDTEVRTIMTSPVVFIDSDAEIDEALALMTDRRIRHLPVVNEDRVVGVVSIGDLVKYLSREQRFHIKYLEDYIHAR